MMTRPTPSALDAFTASLLTGQVRVVDLSHTLSTDFPTLGLPPELGQCAPFRVEQVSAYDERGASWYWNNISCSEHTGTHFDAPIHWITGRDRPGNAVDAVPPRHFIAPACVIDCSAQAARDADYLMTVADIEAFEAEHGRIPAGSWVLMRTDWSHRWSVHRDALAYQNYDATGQHTPGPSAEAVRMLVNERDVLGFGSETIGTDAGQAAHLTPPYPCHSLMHGAGKYGLQCLANLQQLPPTGALIIAAPLKIEHGSGSPLRVIALIPQA
ncbi:MAG: cyclase family protein [Comamonadaceae bacterium]|nr:cyclase family protein [Comamonadaceae bacterium]